MKISKIVCATLVSVAVSSSAYATFQDVPVSGSIKSAQNRYEFLDFFKSKLPYLFTEANTKTLKTGELVDLNLPLANEIMALNKKAHDAGLTTAQPITVDLDEQGTKTAKFSFAANVITVTFHDTQTITFTTSDAGGENRKSVLVGGNGLAHAALLKDVAAKVSEEIMNEKPVVAKQVSDEFVKFFKAVSEATGDEIKVATKTVEYLAENKETLNKYSAEFINFLEADRDKKISRESELISAKAELTAILDRVVASGKAATDQDLKDFKAVMKKYGIADTAVTTTNGKADLDASNKAHRVGEIDTLIVAANKATRKSETDLANFKANKDAFDAKVEDGLFLTSDSDDVYTKEDGYKESLDELKKNQEAEAEKLKGKSADVIAKANAYRDAKKASDLATNKADEKLADVKKAVNEAISNESLKGITYDKISGDYKPDSDAITDENAFDTNSKLTDLKALKEKLEAPLNAVIAEKKEKVAAKTELVKLNINLESTGIDFTSGHLTADDMSKINALVAEAKSSVTAVVSKLESLKAELKDANKAKTDAADALRDKTTELDQVDSGNHIKTAINNTLTQYGEVKKALDTLNEIKEKVANESSVRLTSVANHAKNGIDSMGKDIASALGDIAATNDTVRKAATGYQKGVVTPTNLVVDFIKANQKSIEDTSSAVAGHVNLDIVKFNTYLATNTRLAKLANPFNENLALARAISSLQGDLFADMGSSVASVVKSYTDRYNYDNNVWGSFIGSKGKKDSTDSKLFGFALGYDKAFDNTILGATFTYANSSANSSLVSNKADNFQFGLYSRTVVDANEFDAKLSYGFAKNKLKRDIDTKLFGNLAQDGKYTSKFFDIGFDYGYIFQASNDLFIKPIIGLDYSFAKNGGFTESGMVPLTYGSLKSKVLSAKLATEFRKYLNDGSYFYVTPGLLAELVKKTDDLNVKYVGSDKNIKVKSNDSKGTYFTLQTGAEFNINQNLSTNVNFGVKAKSKDQYYNGTIGLKYKF